MSNRFNQFDRPVDAGEGPLFCLDLTRRLARRTSRLKLDDAVMGRAEKHALLDHLLNLELCELTQKLLLSPLANFLIGIHAMSPV